MSPFVQATLVSAPCRKVGSEGELGILDRQGTTPDGGRREEFPLAFTGTRSHQKQRSSLKKVNATERNGRLAKDFPADVKSQGMEENELRCKDLPSYTLMNKPGRSPWVVLTFHPFATF